MALTVTKSQPSAVWGNKRVRTVSVTGDNFYPAGGYPLTPAQVGLSRGVAKCITGVIRKSDDSTIALVGYNVPNQRLLLYSVATGNQFATGTDLTTYSGRLTFVGV